MPPAVPVEEPLLVDAHVKLVKRGNPLAVEQAIVWYRHATRIPNGDQTRQLGIGRSKGCPAGKAPLQPYFPVPTKLHACRQRDDVTLVPGRRHKITLGVRKLAPAQGVGYDAIKTPEQTLLNQHFQPIASPL